MRHDQTYRGLEEVDLFFEKNSPCVVSLRVRHRIGDIHRSDAVREEKNATDVAKTPLQRVRISFLFFGTSYTYDVSKKICAASFCVRSRVGTGIPPSRTSTRDLA